jgi:hypothetical protein
MSIHYDFIEQNLREDDPQLERFQIQQYLSKHRGKKEFNRRPKISTKDEQRNCVDNSNSLTHMFSNFQQQHVW